METLGGTVDVRDVVYLAKFQHLALWFWFRMSFLPDPDRVFHLGRVFLFLLQPVTECHSTPSLLLHLRLLGLGTHIRLGIDYPKEKEREGILW